MASLSRRVLWSFFHLVRQSSPIFYRRRVLSIFKGSWRQVLSVGFGASLCAIPVGQAVYTLISLQKKFTSLLDKMNSSEESAIWQVIIGARVQMKKLEEEYLKYEASWARAVSLSEMAAEAAYHAGADQVAITVRNHIQLVQIQIQETRELVLKAEALLAASQSEEILKTITEDKNNPPDGGTPVIDSPEEVPEAYMRED
ncbi:diablo IAP-binding mitochondrial protein isoform X2 [Hyla sarda]|uniref:diablo IAP-binding mitochondrial protein isoform X2 n=1 Tax=Hyla sarda TaxID=327740 RepID=UPI0024C28811|nr:diablo IAP-binding mitochondrial protein isoform X2 [Hyla sarda]